MPNFGESTQPSSLARVVKAALNAPKMPFILPHCFWTSEIGTSAERSPPAMRATKRANFRDPEAPRAYRFMKGRRGRPRSISDSFCGASAGDPEAPEARLGADFFGARFSVFENGEPGPLSALLRSGSSYSHLFPESSVTIIEAFMCTFLTERIHTYYLA